jgi:hypothetical protein
MSKKILTIKKIKTMKNNKKKTTKESNLEAVFREIDKVFDSCKFDKNMPREKIIGIIDSSSSYITDCYLDTLNLNLIIRDKNWILLLESTIEFVKETVIYMLKKLGFSNVEMEDIQYELSLGTIITEKIIGILEKHKNLIVV